MVVSAVFGLLGERELGIWVGELPWLAEKLPHSMSLAFLPLFPFPLSLPHLKSEENNHKRNGKNACKVSLLSAFPSLFVFSPAPSAKILKISYKHTRSTKRKTFPLLFFLYFPYVFLLFSYFSFIFFSNTQVF